MHNDTATLFCPANQKDWRRWLRKNHKSSDSVWLVFYKKNSSIPTITWNEAVSEALCFGWIDGKRLSMTDEKFKQLFCKRKPKSTWSKINKEKVEVLIRQRKMTTEGYEAIAVAKQNGSWNVLDEVEAMTIPKDLEKRSPNLNVLSCPYPNQKENYYWQSSCLQNGQRRERLELTRSVGPANIIACV